MPIFTGAVNSNWGTAGNWDTGVLPTSVGAGTDAVFNASSPNCTVNVTGECRNLNFTGYTGTITMNNAINVGSQAFANPNHSVTLSAAMGIAGTAGIVTRANGTTTLTSNGRTWPNTLSINTIAVASNSIATITGNWTVGNLNLGPTGNNNVTLNGAFTITVNGNFFVGMTGGTVSRIIATSGSLTTIKLAGTGTWSTAATFVSAATSATGFGPNITIDTAGTITIADNCYYGGNGVVSGVSSLTYVSGTVIHNGTFRLLSVQTGVPYSVNLNGSSSPSATTTSSTGVNFNNLEFRTASLNNPQVINITGGICVVGNTSINATGATKGVLNTSGGTIYGNGSLSVVGAMRNPSTTIFRFQGTGTWTENTIAVGTIFGLTWQVQINTTGTITIGSNVGLGESGSITYTAGTFTWPAGNILYVLSGTSLYGLGSYGLQIDEINQVGDGSSVSLGFYDTVPIKINTFRLVNAILSYSYFHIGTIGWTANNFYMQSLATSTGNNLRLQSGVEYKVNSILVMTSYSSNLLSSGSNIVLYSSGALSAIFTLAFGATQDVYYTDGGAVGLTIDSSAGQTIWTRGGAIRTGTLNWKNWDYPRTRHSTFLSE